MTTKELWKAIQAKVGADADGIPGRNTASAIADFLGIDVTQEESHTGKASSFADPADVAAFRKCKAKGNSDQACFKVGDNGVGFRGMDCTDPNTPICALPPEQWRARWGDGNTANGKPVIVTWKGKEVLGVMGDTMPSEENIQNGAIIDLNPGYAKEFGITPPFMINNVSWRWA